ncbi:MAG TPA: TetR/AcrR family transcriptional regulator [Sphingopyxis sp.]|nr:TetR/AcrR family transcriptional regulator [Sphingopyxis sp.]
MPNSDTISNPPKAGRGRPRRFDDRRLEVLRTSAHVFSELGFRQATLEDIAGALEMTRPALYHYAKSKDALLAECGAIARNQLTDAFARAELEKTGAEQLKSFFHAYGDFVTAEFGRCFALTRWNEMPPAERKDTKRISIQNDDNVGRMIERGIADGTLRECDTLQVSRAIFASFNGMARWWTKRRDPPVAAIADTILDAFLNGLAPRKG